MILFSSENKKSDSEEPKMKLLSLPQSEETIKCPSPSIRKNLPQTSNLISAGKIIRKPCSHEEIELNSNINLDNDIECLTFPNDEKLIVSKSLRILYYNILSNYPNIQYQIDYYGFNSEVYRYCFDEHCQKIRSISCVSLSTKLIILSKRPKIFKHEFFHGPSSKQPNLKNHYQIIDFNKSIPEKNSERPLIKSRIKKILKSPDKLPEVLNLHQFNKAKSVSLFTKPEPVPPNLQERENKMMKKYKNPNFLYRKKEKNRFIEGSKEKKSEVLAIPVKLYYELMQVPEELKIFKNFQTESSRQRLEPIKHLAEH